MPYIDSHFVCLLYNLQPQDLNAVCDVKCRDNAALMFVDPLTGLIVVIDGNYTGKNSRVGLSSSNDTRFFLPVYEHSCVQQTLVKTGTPASVQAYVAQPVNSQSFDIDRVTHALQ